jgi:hypothetical protein
MSTPLILANMCVAVCEEKMIFNRAIFPMGCATRCALGSRSFIGSFNARAFSWRGIRDPSAFWKQKSQEECCQVRLEMS